MSKVQSAPATDQGTLRANNHTSTSVTHQPSRKLQPRHRRLLAALLKRPVMRESVDRIAGTSNGPHYIQELRGLGLEIHCELIKTVDRDGKTCRPGRYQLLASSRRQARDLLTATLSTEAKT